jgi:Glycogen recognition site of AMP-activated protein kinase
MSDLLISMYIDDELDLDDKIVFVETVHDDKSFKDEALSLLRQEKLIRADVVDHLPCLRSERLSPWRARLLRPFAAAAAGLAAAAVLWLMLWPAPEQPLQPWRFVIYQPDAQGVELAGSFSGWKRIPLRHAGNSGYWEITLELPEGDHRFSYIIEGSRRLADPTIAVRETDDFGGENSILSVKL